MDNKHLFPVGNIELYIADYASAKETVEIDLFDDSGAKVEEEAPAPDAVVDAPVPVEEPKANENDFEITAEELAGIEYVPTAQRMQTVNHGGTVKGGKLFIGEDAVMDMASVADQEVYVGIRPEGFEPAEDGVLNCELSAVEVMGRDVSIVSKNAASVNPVIRSIVNADYKVDVTAKAIRYNLKAHKLFVFNKETEERIYF
jgi:hypothetical protein